jgi:hypothetical protein
MSDINSLHLPGLVSPFITHVHVLHSRARPPDRIFGQADLNAIIVGDLERVLIQYVRGPLLGLGKEAVVMSPRR